MTDTPDQRSRIDELLSFTDRTTPTSSERAIGDIAGSLRRIAQRGVSGDAGGAGGPVALQRRVEALRSEILGTRGSTTPAHVRKALGALGPPRATPTAGSTGMGPGAGRPGVMASRYGGYPGGAYGGTYRGGDWASPDGRSADGTWTGRSEAAMPQDGRILSASQQVLIARVTELTASIEATVRTLQPIRVDEPPDPEAVEATRALILSVLPRLVEESRRLEPRPNVTDADLDELDRLILEQFNVQMAPLDDNFESDVERRQQAQLALLDADRQDLRVAWERFFAPENEGDRIEQVEQVRRQLRVAYATLGKLRDALRDAGLSDEEADSPEARLPVLAPNSDLPDITLAAWLDSVADATGDEAQARLSLGGDFALPDIGARAAAIAAEAGVLLAAVDDDGSSVLTALRDPIASEELDALQEQMDTVAELAGQPTSLGQSGGLGGTTARP
jgi:hypothetical protein